MNDLNTYPLVSVITPCYNTGHLVHKLFDSLISQDYPNIEIFAVNDGSIDNTGEVIKSYIPLFENRGYNLVCLNQSNSGQSAAVNNALKQINGKYLVWPDSDDYYSSPHAISMMVNALENSSKEYAMVRTQDQVIDEQDGHVMYVNGLYTNEHEEKTLFEDCLYTKNNFYFCSGAYMVRSDALMETTKMSIYTEKNAGQNWQLLLPVLYKYRCLTIKEVLYTVLSRAVSHSRGQYKGYESSILKYSSYRDTILETLDRIEGMPESELQSYRKKISIKYVRIFLLNDILYQQRENFKKHYSYLNSALKAVTIYDRMLAIVSFTHLDKCDSVQKIIKRIYRKAIND